MAHNKFVIVVYPPISYAVDALIVAPFDHGIVRLELSLERSASGSLAELGWRRLLAGLAVVDTP